MRARLRLLVLGCLSALVLVVPPAAHADDTSCVGVLPPGTYENVIVPEGVFCLIEGPTLIRGNVTALPDSDLWMQAGITGSGVTVRGSVKGLEDSTVTSLRSEIFGNVVGEKTDFLQLQFGPNVVHGNVHVSGRGDEPSAAPDSGVLICNAVLTNGNITVEKMTVAGFGIRVDNGFCSAPNTLRNGSIKIEDNHILGDATMRIGEAQIENGNLHVFKNSGPGAKFVNNNNVSKGDIQCYENDLPFVGGPNMGRAPNQPPPLMSGRNQCFGTSS